MPVADGFSVLAEPAEAVRIYRWQESIKCNDFKGFGIRHQGCVWLLSFFFSASTANAVYRLFTHTRLFFPERRNPPVRLTFTRSGQSLRAKYPIILTRFGLPTVQLAASQGERSVFVAWFKKGSGTVVRSTLRAVPATVPDPFLNNGVFVSECDARFALGHCRRSRRGL
jgi:hypothetical protein